jgi:hypothetical protein
MAKAVGPITVTCDPSPSNTMSIHKSIHNALVIGAGSGAWNALGQGARDDDRSQDCRP